MSNTYNLYCDESCHLENDSQPVMVLGTIWCRKDKTREIFRRIREIKVKHSLSPTFEIKWTKVSGSKKQFYLDLIDYFFDTTFLNFRAVVSPKNNLQHSKFQQTHDDWYYKQYYLLIHHLLTKNEEFKIYIDIKDTKGAFKRNKLKQVLSNQFYDFDNRIVKDIQAVHSKEIELIQLTDLLIGALGYVNRNLSSNEGKLAIIERIKSRSGCSLKKNTYLRDTKFNILIWEPTGC